ncbi:MAG TPA: hypothetical protein VD767_05395, partial [Thermomicrobiales bacterium]|nr:hypothetical protein [Thermomicrobiales bacterium]
LVYEEYRAGELGRSMAALQLLIHIDEVEAGLAAAESLSFEDGPVITLFTEDEILSAINNSSVL